MYKLYGFSVSNYYNMVKLALLKKGLEFEHVETMPSTEGDYLQMSPMGKVPCLKVDGGYLIETNVILEYLEDAAPGTPLYPADAFGRAKARELMKAAELYLELPGRQLYSSVFFGDELTPDLKARVEPLVHKGVGALNRLLVFSPYATGDTFTYADIVLYYTVSLVQLAVQPVYGMDLTSELKGAGSWMTLMEQDPLVQQVNADRDEALKAFMAAKTSA